MGFFRFKQTTFNRIKKKPNIFTLLTLLIAGILFFSCKVKEVKKENIEEQGAFITIKATRDSVANKTTFKVTNVNVVSSKIRYVTDENKKKEANFLYVVINYKNGQSIEVNTEHPLFKRIDMYSESGKIESKSISLSQGELFLRVPYFGRYKTLSITETINFKEKPVFVIREND